MGNGKDEKNTKNRTGSKAKGRLHGFHSWRGKRREPRKIEFPHPGTSGGKGRGRNSISTAHRVLILSDWAA